MGAQWDQKRICFEKMTKKRKSHPKKGVGSESGTLESRFFEKKCPTGPPKGSQNRPKIDKNHAKNRFFCGWAPGTTFSSIFHEKW